MKDVIEKVKAVVAKIIEKVKEVVFKILTKIEEYLNEVMITIKATEEELITINAIPSVSTRVFKKIGIICTYAIKYIKGYIADVYKNHPIKAALFTLVFIGGLILLPFIIKVIKLALVGSAVAIVTSVIAIILNIVFTVVVPLPINSQVLSCIARVVGVKAVA